VRPREHPRDGSRGTSAVRCLESESGARVLRDATQLKRRVGGKVSQGGEDHIRRHYSRYNSHRQVASRDGFIMQGAAAPLQWFALAFAVLSDAGPIPIFPRWPGVFNPLGRR
jgi:hypothetical protein